MNITKLEVSKKQRLIRLPEVKERVGLSKSHIYLLQAQGLFPKAIKLREGGRAAGYIESEIDTYIQGRIALSRS